MTPDYDRAAIAATTTLIKHGINTAPVFALPILKQTPGVLVISFTEISGLLGIDRSHLITMTGSETQDAITTVSDVNGTLKYVTAYNQRLPVYVLQRALARELGHIVLGHDGSRPDEVRSEEARCFAHHLLCPRALIKGIQDAGISITAEVLGNVTGCYDRCLQSMRTLPGTRVPPELNKLVKEMFSDYIEQFVAYTHFCAVEDTSPVVDFGSYMEQYEDI